MIPDKLKKGDEVRVISPSRSMSMISKETQDIANKRFDELGLKVSFSKNILESDEFVSSSIESRIEDLHAAFLDKNVKGIFTTIGGYNSNQLLKHIDFDIIKNNPKIICGYSDITALSNSIYSKTSLVTYYGPHYSTLGMKKGLGYTTDYLKKCLMQEEEFEISTSTEWSDDLWFLDQEKRNFVKNPGCNPFLEGEASGTIVGGNLCTLNLLQGTEFMPSLEDSILFLEDDEASNPTEFDRNLQSLLHQPGFQKVKGIVIGRFQKASKIPNNLLEKILSTKKELQNIPIITNADFGHTTPHFTFPIGGTVKIKSGKETTIKIIKH